MEDDSTARVFDVIKFSSVLPASTHATRRWVDIPTEELKDEIVHRNGRFQSMLGFFRHTLQACMVIDAAGRLIYINQALEQYWKLRLWDIQGKNLCQIMRLDERETARNRSERERVLGQRFPEVFLEH